MLRLFGGNTEKGNIRFNKRIYRNTCFSDYQAIKKSKDPELGAVSILNWKTIGKKTSEEKKRDLYYTNINNWDLADSVTL